MIPKSLLRHGFQLFPVVDGGKLPAVAGWQDAATDKPKWLNGGHCNAGIFTGRYRDGALLVVDLDKKNGKDGEQALSMLFPELPNTFTVETPSGGKHLYFYTKQRLANSAGKIAPGVDVRSQGGYVVAPGSVVAAGEYRIVLDVAVADAPAWLEAECKAARDKAADRTPIVELDQDSAIARAINFLANRRGAVRGDGGDDWVFVTACKVKDIGLSELACFEVMSEHWAAKCEPPLDPAYLADKVSNAYRHGQEAPGSKAKTADGFEPVATTELAFDLPKNESKKKDRLFFLDFDDIEPDLSRVDLIEDVLSQDACSVIYGESNVGKTFVALDMAFHVAMGWDWLGKRVTQGAVVYIAAEGAHSLRNRVAVLKKHYAERLAGVQVPLYILPCAVNLLDPRADLGDLIALIRQREKERGVKVRLAFIDTVSRALAGGNENAPDDMGAFVNNCDVLRLSIKTHLSAIHHCGKDLERGARGHSLLRAAQDTELSVEQGAIFATKQRDMDKGPPIYFDLLPIALGRNPYGKEITSCVVVSGNPIGGDLDLSPRDQYVFQQFLEAMIAAKEAGINFVTTEDWRNLCKNGDKSALKGKDCLPEERSAFGKAFKASRDRLGKVGKVMNINEDQWVMAKRERWES